MTIPSVQWKPEYETGNPLVDAQHQSIFSIISALSHAIAADQGDVLLEQTIQSVKDYTTIHFDTEEQYMLEHQYPDYDQHWKKHEALRVKFSSFEQQHYPDMYQRTIVLANFLTIWLVQQLHQHAL